MVIVKRKQPQNYSNNSLEKRSLRKSCAGRKVPVEKRGETVTNTQRAAVEKTYLVSRTTGVNKYE
jgi:hypothetical protein